MAQNPRSLKHWTPTHLHIGTDHLAARVAVLEGKPGDEPTVNDINSPSEQAARIMGSVESGLPNREVGFHIPGPGTVFPSSRLGGSLKLHAAVARRTADSRMLGAMMHRRVC